MAEVTGLTAARVNQLVGQVIKSARVSGSRLLIKLANGTEIDVGDIAGIPMVDPQAVQIPVAAIGIRPAMNMQAFIQSIAGMFNSLATTKVDRADLPKILSGKVDHYSRYDIPTDSFVRDVNDYPTQFPNGYFSAVPSVIITPFLGDWTYFSRQYSVLNVTARGFSINAWRGNPNPPNGYNQTIFNYLAVQA